MSTISPEDVEVLALRTIADFPITAPLSNQDAAGGMPLLPPPVADGGAL